MSEQVAAMHCIVITKLLQRHRFRYGSEKELQDGVEHILRQCKFSFGREVPVEGGIIDFIVRMADGSRIGLELKIKGSPTAVLQQLGRYSANSDLSAIILVTARLQLSNLPKSLNGIPLVACPLVGSVL